ncbi:DUF5789 family protein [Haloferacaceae archaeon DSL9]
MSDDEAESEPPAVELGDEAPVSGAPVARVASRLTWPQKRSDIINKEGDTLIRTPDGPTSLSTILERTDETYFDRRQTFVTHVFDVIGREPIPTDE